MRVPCMLTSKSKQHLAIDIPLLPDQPIGMLTLQEATEKELAVLSSSSEDRAATLRRVAEQHQAELAREREAGANVARTLVAEVQAQTQAL